MHTTFELDTCNKLALFCIYVHRDSHILILHFLQPSLPVLYTLSSQATHEAVHLLCRMLVFDPVSSVYFYIVLMN